MTNDSRRAGGGHQGGDRSATDRARARAIQAADSGIRFDDGTSPPGEGNAALKLVALLFFLAVGAWVWLAPPAVLEGPPELTVTPVIDETGVRMDMWVQATRIFAFQRDSGRLPTTAAEAGEAVEGVTYEVLSPEVFRLVGQGREFRLTWQSTQSEAELLGDAVTRVQEGVVR